MKRVTHLLNHSFNFGVFVNFLDEGSNTKCVGNTNLNNNNNNNKRQQSFVLQCAWIIHVLYVLVDWMRTASLCNPKPSVFSLTIGCVLLTVSAWQRKVTQLPINPVVLLSHNCPTLFPLPSIISLVLLSHNCLHVSCSSKSVTLWKWITQLTWKFNTALVSSVSLTIIVVIQEWRPAFHVK